MSLNFGSRRWSYGIARKPVNRLVLGPFHTLHLPDGKLAVDTWWYESPYEDAVETYDLVEKFAQVRRFETFVRRSVRRISFDDLLIKAIINYCRALDRRDWNASFLQLWSVLEDLTFTDGGRYDVTVKRASFLWKEHRYHSQILLHLRDLRNSFVHENATSDEIEDQMYDLKRYVEKVLMFHLTNGHRFANTEEVRQFLDLPQDDRELKKKMDLLHHAVRYRIGKRM